MGFYYRDTADSIRWLWVFNKCPWMRNYLTRDLVRKIADYMVTWIGVPDECGKQLVEKQNRVFHKWYTQRHTHISDFARREGATTLIVAMANCIPPKYSVLIICTGKRNAAVMFDLLSPSRRAENVQVQPYATPASIEKDFDFVFGEAVDLSGYRPRGKLLYFL